MVSRLNLASSPSQPETALTQEEVEENNQVDCVYFLRSLQQIESPEEAFSDSPRAAFPKSASKRLESSA